jgi:hypothetical protein
MSPLLAASGPYCSTVHRIFLILTAISQPILFRSSVALSRISYCSNVWYICSAT